MNLASKVAPSRHGSRRVILAGFALLALGVGAAGPLRAEDSWTVLEPPTNKNLLKLSFTDDLHGWAVGNAGTIIATADGAESWTVQQSPVAFDLVDICVLPNGAGWALAQEVSGLPWGNRTTVIKTTNGGAQWFVQTTFDQIYHAVDFASARRGCLVGDLGQILVTDDGGATWSSAQIASQETAVVGIHEVKFHSPTFVLAMGGQYDWTGIIWSSQDGGQTWTHTRVAGEPVWASHVFAPDDILVVGGDLDYGCHTVRTSDVASDVWNYTDLRTWGQANAVAFRSDVEGWATLGYARAYLYTVDAGHTWTSLPTPNNLSVMDITFTSPDVGYMVGLNGAVLRYSGQTTTGVETDLVDIERTALFQNAPNPFHPLTQISFRTVEAGPVSLVIYDLAGRKVGTVIDEDLPAGMHARDFKAGTMASGVYFYRLSTPNQVHTKQMVVLK
ncbi:MAG: YCF48-related protein [Candidatus Eiseniibacteriota bacterium]